LIRSGEHPCAEEICSTQLASGRICRVLPANRGWPVPLFPLVNDFHWLNPE
jgi:hypothetical protein